MPASIFGRDPELASVREFLDGVRGAARAMVIAGDPGIGKTTVWLASRVGPIELVPSPRRQSGRGRGKALLRRTRRSARRRAGRRRVRPSDRAESGARSCASTSRGKGALQQRAVATAFLGAVTALAREHPVIVAVDDVQWLDRASAQVLSYAVRRLTDEPVGFSSPHERRRAVCWTVSPRIRSGSSLARSPSALFTT